MHVSDIFIFSARGRGRGSPRRREGGRGVGFLLENPRGGGVSKEGVGGARRVFAGNLGRGGGGG